MKQFVMDGWVTSSKIDTRTTATGRTVTSFSINSPTNRKGQDGGWESVPQFFPMKYWAKSDRDPRPDSIVPGAKLVLAGRPTYEEWEHDGEKRSRVVFVAEELWQAEAPQKHAPADVHAYDEDIPF